MIDLPTICPSCGGPVESYVDSKSKIETLYCVNEVCPGRVREDLVAISGRDVLELASLGPELASKLASEGFVLDIGDLFEFIQECGDVREKDLDKYTERLKSFGFSVAAISKLINSSAQAKTKDWDRWIVALNIEGVGKVLGKQLAQALDLSGIDTLCAKLLSLKDLDGVGDKKLSAIHEWAKTHEDLCLRLHELGVKPSNPFRVVVSGPQPLAGMVVCITGEFSLEREVIQKHLTSLGAICKSGVTKKLTHLITGAGAGKSKLAKANELGLERLGKDWLIKVLDAAGVEYPSSDFEMDVGEF